MKNAQIVSLNSLLGSAPSRFLASGLNVNSLRTNALLRTDEWKELDAAILDVSRVSLQGIADLRAAGLVKSLGGLGTLLSEYERLSDMDAASVDMAGETLGEEDTVAFDLVSVPVPITHKDFRLNIRRLEASRRLGDSLDVIQARVAARKVAEALETMLFVGQALTVGGATIYGYTNHPNRTTGTGADWGTLSAVYPNVLSMVDDAMAEGFNGPFGIYVARVQYIEALDVYTDGSGQSAVDRCVANIPGLNWMKLSDEITAGEAVLVNLQADTVDVAVAQDIVTVQWNEMGGMIERFKVFAAMVPRVKADQEGKCGIVHYSSL